MVLHLSRTHHLTSGKSTDLDAFPNWESQDSSKLSYFWGTKNVEDLSTSQPFGKTPIGNMYNLWQCRECFIMFFCLSLFKQCLVDGDSKFYASYLVKTRHFPNLASQNPLGDPLRQSLPSKVTLSSLQWSWFIVSSELPWFYPLKTWKDIQTFFIQTITQPLLKPQNLIGNRCLYIYTVYIFYLLIISFSPTRNSIATSSTSTRSEVPVPAGTIRSRSASRGPAEAWTPLSWVDQANWLNMEIRNMKLNSFTTHVSSSFNLRFVLCLFFVSPVFPLFFSDSPYFDGTSGAIFSQGPDSSSLPSSPNFPTHRGSSWSRKKSHRIS